MVQGMPVLSSLTRGTGTGDPNLRPEQYIPIRAIKVAADVPAAQRVNLQLLRSDSRWPDKSSLPLKRCHHAGGIAAIKIPTALRSASPARFGSLVCPRRTIAS